MAAASEAIARRPIAVPGVVVQPMSALLPSASLTGLSSLEAAAGQAAAAWQQAAQAAQRATQACQAASAQ